MSTLRIFTAPGESPDLLELLSVSAQVGEVASLGELAGETGPAVVLLSRSLLAGLSTEEWYVLPEHITVVTTDSQARAAAERAGRLWGSVDAVSGGGLVRRGWSELDEALEGAFRHSQSLLGRELPR
ncbi:MAG: hypothetical protein JSU98_10150 [Gemmatimonadales bacterium]|jgi:hypothetical protein|nr:MAG: hypothetical protein JSU98_10150 [Gemmatimonadales bacterium]